MKEPKPDNPSVRGPLVPCPRLVLKIIFRERPKEREDYKSVPNKHYLEDKGKQNILKQNNL